MTSQNATLFAVASSDIIDSCLLRDINSTMYCFAPSHYVTPPPSTMLTIYISYLVYCVTETTWNKNET